MTKQEYFEKLKIAAYNGTFPSTSKDVYGTTTCRYRADKTACCKKRCAIGILIPDEVYDEFIEGNAICRIINFFEIPDNMTLDDLALVQSLHDSMATEWNADEFIKGIKNLACFAGLE